MSEARKPRNPRTRMDDHREYVRAKMRISDAGCWEWQGIISNRGYGQVAPNGRRTGAHRLSYEAFVGPIPEGLELDHLCRNTRCVNPDHLEPVTRAENMRRVVEAMTECRRGHPFDAANTYVERNGSRKCRTCQRERRKATRAAQRG